MSFYEGRQKYRASWSFNKKLRGLSEKNFNREGTSWINSGFVLDHEVITKKFSDYATSLAKSANRVSGEVEYFEPDKSGLTKVAEEMAEKSNIKNVLNGNCDKRDEIAEEIMDAIEEKPSRKEVRNFGELSDITDKYAVLGADLVFQREHKATNFRFDSSKIRSYQKERSEPDWDEPFKVRLYGDEEFRKEVTKKTSDLAGRWNDWDLARNKTHESLKKIGLLH